MIMEIVKIILFNFMLFIYFYFLVHSESEIVEEDIVNTRHHRPDIVYDHRRNQF